MSHVLFVTWDGGGNVPPALGIAGELRDRGHRVSFLGHAQQRAVIDAAGFGFTPYTHARPWSSAEPGSALSAAAFAVSDADRRWFVDARDGLKHLRLLLAFGALAALAWRLVAG